MQPTRSQVHPSEHDFLNRQFYSASPHQFFQHRLLGLVAVASGSADLGNYPDGITYREFNLRNGPDGSREPDIPKQDEYTADMYAASESTVLLHHTAEALLRLYLGHANRNPCPWLAIASLTSFSRFKDQIRTLQSELDQVDVMDDVLEVFSYSSKPDFIGGGDPTEIWNEHREALRDVLNEAISILLADANVYNASKHGMAVVAGEVRTSIAVDGEDPLMERDGMSLKHLENVLVQQDNARYWQVTTWWPQPEKAMTLIMVMTWMMRSLWRCARAHYSIARLTDLPFLLRRQEIDHLLTMGTKEGFNISTMSVRLHTEPSSVSS